MCAEHYSYPREVLGESDGPRHRFVLYEDMRDSLETTVAELLQGLGLVAPRSETLLGFRQTPSNSNAVALRQFIIWTELLMVRFGIIP